MSFTENFENVSVVCKANVYFDGKVASHTVQFVDGSKKTLGLIYPGSFKFDTGVPEVMEIISGETKVRQAGQTEWTSYGAGTAFEVPGKSYFEISVDSGIAQYICSFK
ncbi:MAG: pyrimidine/purine nucleoside phosphorylase [Verrucomicrobiota bacterium]|nr:pyrimidine/purine nucleoside phosphorylase [Verrucomicrobiota bacterium]